jgi:LPS export ABC transporter protein LptC
MLRCEIMDKLTNIRRFLAIAGALASILVVATIVFRMQKESSPKLAVRKLPVQVDVSLQKVHFTEVRQGVKRWDLTAERAEYNKATDTSSLSGVKLIIAGGDKVGELRLSAERADYRNATKDIILSGDVKGEGSKGIRFSTSRITYVAARSRLETAERVRFSDAELELEGVGMEFQTQTRKVRLLKDVSAVYRPQGGK